MVYKLLGKKAKKKHRKQTRDVYPCIQFKEYASECLFECLCSSVRFCLFPANFFVCRKSSSEYINLYSYMYVSLFTNK